jgi:peptide-methionine (R)-S-oxide reductase
LRCARRPRGARGGPRRTPDAAPQPGAAAPRHPATRARCRRVRRHRRPPHAQILRRKGTERPWTSELNKHKEQGVYTCAGCGTPLFLSDHKFESGCGWPSFFLPADKAAVEEHRDVSLFMVRTEVTCSKCGGHLGHVFDDGPRDKTGLRYCINGVALGFSNASTAPAK